MPLTFSVSLHYCQAALVTSAKDRSRTEKVDEKNICNGRKNDGSCMDYQGADGIRDAFSVIKVHCQDIRSGS